MNQKELTEMFGKPISVYTDDQAVDDGELVALNRKDRVTRTVYNWLENTIDINNPKLPNGWPVSMFDWFGRTDSGTKAVAMCAGLLSSHGAEATRVYEEETGGGIFALHVEVDKNGKPLSVSKEGSYTGENRKLWILPNENGGTTLMFPEDY